MRARRRGADDWTVEADPSEMMARAMTAAGKPYKRLIIPATTTTSRIRPRSGSCSARFRTF